MQYKMKLLKRLYRYDGVNQLKKVNAIQTTDTNNLVKRADYNTNLLKLKKKLDHDHHNKYITTQEFNRLTSENFTARLK